MLANLEFYTCPDGAVNIKPMEGAMFPYDTSCRNITEEMMVIIRDRYPEAFAALSQIYSRSEKNKIFYEYNMVHRFIRCNFGEYDTLSCDVSHSGDLNIEEVKCPLRGECIHEGVICKPRLQTALSEREHEVATLLGSGMTKQDVADELHISICTVSRHVANIKARLHFKHTHQIVSHFHN